jgi:heme oxygenase
MLYVLEGSRLGGRLLLRRTLANPDPQVRSATRYLGHGGGRDLWRPFLEQLEASTAVAAAPDTAIAGAREAFALFIPGASHG